jgi:CIC family chloride channel protein
LLVAAIVVGIGGGYGAVVFRYVIDGETQLAFHYFAPALHALSRAQVVPVLVCGGIITAFIINRFASEAKGHGVPEVMAAIALRGGVIRPRIIAVKAIASATCIGFGGSCGREGPIVQIGSTIGSALGQLAGMPSQILRTMVACGAAAGISATFNAPIGGVFFASEVILGEFAPRSFAMIVVSSVVAAVIGRAHFGNHPSFTASAFYLVSPAELGLYALLGILAAAWAAAFVRVLYFAEDLFDRWRVSPLVRAGVGFGAVGIIGAWFPQVFGVGYGVIDAMLASHVPAAHSFVLAVLKPIATSLTLGSGGSGGVFAPSLYTGAMLGNTFGTVVHAMFPSWTAGAAAYGLVGMAAVFAGAAEAPITAIMIVFEMSNDYTIILPLMVATVIATLLGRRLLGYTIYEMKLVRRGIDWARVRKPRPLTQLRVGSIQRQPEFVAASTQPIRDIANQLRHSAEFVVPVLEGNQFIGIVTASNLAAALLTNPEMSAGELAQSATTTLTRDDSVESAAVTMADPNTPLLPVIDPGTRLFQGIVTRKDVLDAYRSWSEV